MTVHRDDQWVRAIGMAGAAVALFGIVVSAALTYLKFSSDFLCNSSAFSACSGEGCEVAMSSAWSTWGGLPVTVYGAAYYVVALFAATDVAAGRRMFHGVGSHVVIALGLVTPLVSIAMALYAKVWLDTFCKYCALLYLVSALSLVVAVACLFKVRRPRLRDLVRRGALRTGARNGAILAASLFAVATTGQGFAYQAAQRMADPPEECIGLDEPPPETTLVQGSKDPSWVFAVFVDPACNYCRSLHAQLGELIANAAYGSKLQLRYYYVPRDQECYPQFPIQSEFSRKHSACRAARAIECVERRSPGAGVRMLDALFVHAYRTEKPIYDAAGLVSQAGRAGVVARDDASDPFFKCIHDDEQVAIRIKTHMRYAINHGMRVTPWMQAAPVGKDGTPVWKCAIKFEGNKSRTVFEELLEGDMPPRVARCMGGE